MTWTQRRMERIVWAAVAVLLLAAAAAAAAAAESPEPTMKLPAREVAERLGAQGFDAPRNDWELFAMAAFEPGLVDSIQVLWLGTWPGEDLVRVGAVLQAAAIPYSQRPDTAAAGRWRVFVTAPPGADHRAALTDSLGRMGLPSVDGVTTEPAAAVLEMTAAELAMLAHDPPAPPPSQAPVPLLHPMPELPYVADVAVTGEVTLMVFVGVDGKPGEIIAHEATAPVLGEAAAAAARRWRFLPGTQRGIPVGTWLQTTFHFRGDAPGR